VSISFARNHRWQRLRPGLIVQEPDWSLIDRLLSRSDTSGGGTLLKYLDEVAIGCQTAWCFLGKSQATFEHKYSSDILL